MAEFFSNLSPVVKVSLLIIILVGVGVVWWLVSPLFLDGPTLNQDLDEDVEILLSGEFNMFDGSHWGEGTAQVVETLTGQYQVQFVDVEIANGPALVVYLSAKSSFSSINDSPGEYIELGDLPANAGNFYMEIPDFPNFDIGSVLIWCEPFEVAFTFASMMML